MHFNKCFIFFIISLVYICVKTQYNGLISKQLFSQQLRAATPKLRDMSLLQNKFQHMHELQKQIPHTSPQGRQQFLQQFLQQAQGKLKIQLFYECLCPDCRVFDTQQFTPTVKKLGNRLDVHVYPYGKAETIISANGTIEFLCQHGPAECYGNKLHSCAIDFLGITQAVEFNSCMMSFDQTNGGSDNDAADKCGRLMNINSEPIKHCATSPRGSVLLKNYGDESRKVGYFFVPYILINGQVYSGGNLLRDVCNTFQSPPPECYE